MSVETKPTSYTSEAPNDFVPTTADTESPITPKVATDERWQELIDQLISWAQQPDFLADEGIDPPSRETVLLAARLAVELKKGGAACPDSAVPDPNGGIVFTYGSPDSAMVYYVWDDGTVDRCIFAGARLIERLRIR